jgi:hypothetical protein
MQHTTSSLPSFHLCSMNTNQISPCTLVLRLSVTTTPLRTGHRRMATINTLTFSARFLRKQKRRRFGSRVLVDWTRLLISRTLLHDGSRMLQKGLMSGQVTTLATMFVALSTTLPLNISIGKIKRTDPYCSYMFLHWMDHRS